MLRERIYRYVRLFTFFEIRQALVPLARTDKSRNTSLLTEANIGMSMASG